MSPEQLAEDLLRFLKQRSVIEGMRLPDDYIFEELRRFFREIPYRDSFFGEWIREQVRREHFSLESRAEQRMDRLEHMINKIAGSQLPAINKAIAGLSFNCAYQERSDHGYPNFITVTRSGPNAAPHKSDPGLFIKTLIDHAAVGEALVIVDPYALAREDESGSASSAVDSIIKIAKNTSIGHLYLYCRRDVTILTEWEKLSKGINGKQLTVFFGDLHDRYLFAGSSVHIKGRTHTCIDATWNGCKYWQGSAFGGSINGIAKRPTYILKFEASDVGDLISYLKSACKSELMKDFAAGKKKAALAQGINHT